MQYSMVGYLTALVCVLLSSIDVIMLGEWRLGDFICDAWCIVDNFLNTTCAWISLFLVMDRFISTLCPHFYTMLSKNWMNTVSSIPWVLSTVFISIGLLLRQRAHNFIQADNMTFGQCFMRDSSKSEAVYFIVFSFIAPYVLTLICLFCVKVYLGKKAANNHRLVASESLESVSDILLGCDTIEPCDKHSIRQHNYKETSKPLESDLDVTESTHQSQREALIGNLWPEESRARQSLEGIIQTQRPFHERASSKAEQTQWNSSCYGVSACVCDCHPPQQMKDCCLVNNHRKLLACANKGFLIGDSSSNTQINGHVRNVKEGICDSAVHFLDNSETCSKHECSGKLPIKSACVYALQKSNLSFAEGKAKHQYDALKRTKSEYYDSEHRQTDVCSFRNSKEQRDQDPPLCDHNIQSNSVKTCLHSHKNYQEGQHNSGRHAAHVYCSPPCCLGRSEEGDHTLHLQEEEDHPAGNHRDNDEASDDDSQRLMGEVAEHELCEDSIIVPEQVISQQHRTTNHIALVVILYAILWVPFYILRLVLTFYPKMIVYHYIYNTLHLLGYFSSGICPWIYYAVHGYFTKTTWLAFKYRIQNGDGDNSSSTSSL